MTSRYAFYRDPVIWVLFLGTFALYLASMPKTIALEDDSIFVLAGYFNGISHPPGYPLYTLVLKLFTLVPIGDIPARAHASSAFFAALGCCSLFCIFRLIGVERYLAALAAIAFALSATFWSQAIITEVYSLNLLLNLGLLFFSLRIFLDFNCATRPKAAPPRDFFLFSILLGLALSNHWPLTVLVLPAYLLLLARPFFTLENKFVTILPAVGIAALFYLYLYFNNQASPPINFSGKFGSFKELIEYVMRSHYASVDFQDTAGWPDKGRFARDLMLQIVRELNLLLILAGIGWYRLLQAPATRRLGLAMSWAVLANSLMLVLLISFDYSHLYAMVFRVYPIVSIAMLFVLAGFAMVSNTEVGGVKMTNAQLATILLLGSAFNLYASLPQNYRHDYNWGEEYAQRILSEVPADAILIAEGEVELGLLAYYHLVKQQRPDIKLYSASGLLLDNRLFDYRLDDKKGFIEKFVDENRSEQFYAANNFYGVNTVSGTVFTDRLGKREGESQQSITNHDIDLIMKWSAEDYTHDPWTRIAVTSLRQKAIAIISPILKSATDTSLREFASASILRLIQSEADALHFLKSMLDKETEINTAFYRTQLDAIERGNLLSKQDDSHYAYIAARASQAQQNTEQLHAARRQACQNWPSRKNIYCSADTGG